jgi:hypothetical protein
MDIHYNGVEGLVLKEPVRFVDGRCREYNVAAL